MKPLLKRRESVVRTAELLSTTALPVETTHLDWDSDLKNTVMLIVRIHDNHNIIINQFNWWAVDRRNLASLGNWAYDDLCGGGGGLPALVNIML